MAHSPLHKQLDALKTALLTRVAHAAVDGLSPLGALTATLAVADELVLAILQGAVAAERAGVAHAVDDYIAVVTACVNESFAHAAELCAIAKAKASAPAPAPLGTSTGPATSVAAQREVAELAQMFSRMDIDMRARKPS